MSIAPIERNDADRTEGFSHRPARSRTFARDGDLRSAPIPVREPRPASRVDLPERDMPGQGHLMLTLPMPERRQGPPRRGVTGPEPVAAQLSTLEAAVPEERAAAVYPEPSAWATRFLLAALEVTHGVRPAAQLVRWTTPEVHEALARRAALAGRLRSGRAAPAMVSGALRVGTVLTCQTTVHACEVAAVVHDRDRVRAVAMRLEGLGTRWRVTALQIG